MAAGPDTERSVLERAGCSVVYHATGDADAERTAVLVHGFGQRASSMADLGARLLATDAVGRTLALDLRGHGATRGPSEDAAFSYAAMSEDLVALLEAESPSGAHLVGHSMGGQLALLASMQRPDLARSFTALAAGPCREITDARERRGWERAASFFERADADALAEALAAAAPTGLGDRPDLSPGALYAGARGADLARIIRGGFFSIRGNEAECGKVDVPTLVVAGERDAAWLGPARRLAELVPRSRLVILAEAGHLLHLEQPDACAAAIARLVADSEAQAE